jgi:hypothetical protein
MTQIRAPWTQEQVDALNRYQREGRFHAFTCGCDDRCDAAHVAHAEKNDDRDYGLLVATKDGWVCPVCGYTQNWAHAFMAAAPVAAADGSDA